MSVWTPQSVDEVPEVFLAQWQIMQLDDGSQYFVGTTSTEGRVSSRIVSFDKQNLRGVTESGRVYQLLGPAGYSHDADYLWRRWCSINGINKTDYHVATKQVVS